MGMPSAASLRKFLTDEDIFGDDEGMLRFHTKNNPSEAFREFQIYDYLCAITDKLLGAPRCPEDKIAKRQYVQYEWVRITMELYRREKWFSSGLIYWMFNDCWPACGWAIIDYYARPKAAWYGFRRVAAPVVASIDEENGRYRLHVCCDRRAPASGTARLFLQSFDRAEPLAELRTDFHVDANTSAVVLEGELPKAGADALLMAEISGEGFFDRTWFFEGRPQDCAFPETKPVVAAATADSLTIRAEKYIHALVLDGDCVFDDNFFSMLPGEERMVRFVREKAGEIELRALGSKEPSVVVRV